MGNLECPQCGNALANGVAVCGACGKEVNEAFLQSHGMTPAAFEKRIEKDLLIAKLVAKGTQEKGLTQEVWIGELNKRAKVEIFAK